MSRGTKIGASQWRKDREKWQAKMAHLRVADVTPFPHPSTTPVSEEGKSQPPLLVVPPLEGLKAIFFASASTLVSERFYSPGDTFSFNMLNPRLAALEARSGSPQHPDPLSGTFTLYK